jgi:Tol biopolymer transport system component
MRLRAATVTATLAATLVAPLATPASAVTTTSTVVVYLADTNGNHVSEPYKRNADGSGSPTRLFTNTEKLLTPALSPDGSKLAYLENAAGSGQYWDYRLYVRAMNPVGPATMAWTGVVSGSPSWSRDGSRIVVSGWDPDTVEEGTWIVSPDGSTEPVLVPTTDTRRGDEPAFSPSGKQVALDDIVDGEYAGIDMVTLETGARARIPGTTGGSDPVWSPDGQTILFQKELSGCGVGLYRVPAGGGTPVTVRAVPNHFLGSAEWSRDGSQLFWNDVPMFECAESDELGEIWVGDADAGGAQKVVATPTIGEFGTTVAGGIPAPADTTAPAAPAIAAAGTVSATSAKISWPAVGDATDFVVLRKASGDPAPTSVTDGTLVYHGPAHSATATGLVTGATYDLYVFAVDGSDNTSSVSAAHPVKPTAPPVVGAIPRVGTKTPTPTFPIAWSGNATSYQVDVGENWRGYEGVWSTTPVYGTYVASTAEKTAQFPGKQAHTYYVRVRGFDGLGNATAFSAPQAASIPIDDAWSGFSYTSGWVAKTASSTHYLSTYHATVQGAQTMSARPETSGFVVVGDKCPTCGAFKVYVDGVLKRTVDTYSSTSLTRQALYVGGDLGAVKPHSIKIVTVGTSGRPRVNIDAIALSR